MSVCSQGRGCSVQRSTLINPPTCSNSFQGSSFPPFHIDIYTPTYIHTHKYIHTLTHTYTYTHTYTHIHKHTHTLQTTHTPHTHICTILVTCAKCGVCSTLCCKIRNISRSTEFFGL